jgi:protein SCO1/2
VSARLRLAACALAACAAAAVVVVLLVGRGDGAALGPGFAGALRPPGIPAARFSLTDQDGRAAGPAQYRGSVVVVTFMYSTCQDTCPVTAQQIRGALDDLGHDVPALAVSVDPAGDTPQRARAFLLRQHLTGRMRFLLGSRAQLAPVWRAFGIAPQLGKLDHTAYVVLLDRAGRQRIGFPVSKLTPEGLAHDIRLLERGRRA